MRAHRTAAALAAASVLGLGPVTAVAGAAETATGAGSAGISATALALEIGGGEVLSVRLLTEEGAATIDPARGTPAASASLVPAAVSSGVAPALTVAPEAVATHSTGTEDKKGHQVSLPAVPGVAGTANAVVSSVVDVAGARSGANAGLAGLNLAGLMKAPTAVIQANSKAAGDHSAAVHAVSIPSVTVLDLDGLLEALGLRLTDLPVQTVLDLLAGLGVDLNGIADPAEAVATLNGAIDLLQDETGAVTAELCAELDSLLGTLGEVVASLPVPPVTDTVDGALPDVGDDPLPLPDQDGSAPLPVPLPDEPDTGLLGAAALDDIDCSSLTKTAEQLLDEVQSTLSSLLSVGVAELATTPLLSVSDVEIAVRSVATDSVDTSVAEVVASIGEVKVGELAVPGVPALDLADPTGLLAEAEAAIDQAVGDVLALIDGALADLVSVDLLAVEENVGTAAGYVNALSTVTAVTATITPPVGGLAAAAVPLDLSVEDAVESLGGTLPAVSVITSELEAALGGLELLSAPAVLTVGQLSGNANFRPAAAPVPPATPSGELPRTGAEGVLPVIGGLGLAGLGLAIRRLLRASATA